MMNEMFLIAGVLANPLICGLLVLLVIPSRFRIKEIITVFSTGLSLICSLLLYSADISLSIPWLNQVYAFELRLDTLSRVLLVAVSGFSLLITIYSVAYMKGQNKLNQFYAYLLVTLSLASGVLFANNLFLMLIFWEALLVTLVGFIALGGKKESMRTALKALIINGVADLLILIGVALTIFYAGHATMSSIHLPLDPYTSIAFLLLLLGSCAKAGAMPFHTWIPDAATHAPLPFMAFIPAALEKLLGIYLLARISLNLFILTPSSWLSPFLMIMGCVTIILANMMTFVQKDYKRLLSYCAICQVGYMMLGIGTAVPIGIMGGIFHMLNHAIYKSGLFMTAGSIEKQCGTTNLEELGGLGRKMPVTFIIFLITACSITGIPPFNGFFSKELVYEGALERHWIFYALAVAGSFLTAISFLKLGHAAYLGKPGKATSQAKESSPMLLIPMGILALACLFFGVANQLPLQQFIQPVLVQAGLGQEPAGHEMGGAVINPLLLTVSLAVLVLAFLNHLFGFLRTKSGLLAEDHLYRAPVLTIIYAWAEKRYFDPYHVGRYVIQALARLLFKLERVIDWIVTRTPVILARWLGKMLQKLQNGSYSLYIILALGGALIMLLNLILNLKG